MRKLSRRQLLATGAAGTAAGVAGLLGDLTGDVAAQEVSSPSLSKWAQTLPTPSTKTPDGQMDGVDLYDVKMEEFTQSLHPDLPATTLWGYDGEYPGGTYDVQAGEPVKFRYDNSSLPETHLLDVDTAVPGTQADDYANYDGPVPEVRNVVHLHGANIASMDDGQSTSWRSPGGATGPGYVKDVQHMPNDQSRGTLLYHPHALGITRLNVYAGMAGLYYIRDEEEEALNLPTGDYEVPLVIQDRTFNADGSLHYPSSWVSEFSGDTALVNGAVWPYMEVEPRQYRFRVVNASNARAYNLSLANESESSSAVPTVHQIAPGHEFLESVVSIGTEADLSGLTVTPFERAEIVVDFSGFEGETLTLTNDAEFPYQGNNSGSDLTDLVQFQVQDTSVEDPTTPAGNLSLPSPTDYDVSETRVQRTNTLGMQSNNGSIKHTLNGKGMLDGGPYHRPHLGTTEVWEFFNDTGKTHPMHMHLVTFRVIGRGPDGTEQPDPNEQGPKDVVRVDPGETVRVIAEFSDYTGKYPWHCHMLEHEDNSMMRMFDVIRGELVDYANDAGVITEAGVQQATEDWQNGEISQEVLGDVISRYRSGDSIAEPEGVMEP